MGSEIKRKLASIQRIEEIRDIENADAIQAYRVLGWWVVDKKNAHKIGDLVVYLTIDSWVPHELAPFLSKGSEPREYNGVKGERLRTIKLRGTTSQGLLLKMSSIPLNVWASENSKTGEVYYFEDMAWNEGDDLTDELKIQKWEAPIPTQLQGQMKGNFPSWARKTDQERCQNIWPEIQKQIEANTRFEVTIKLDGSSASFGLSPEDEYVVCSRNLSLKTDQEGNAFVNAGRRYDLETKLNALGRPLMISGELCGPGIQRNQEGLKECRVFVFDVFDPFTGSYLANSERQEIVTALGLEHAPVLHESITLSELGIQTLDDLLKYAEGPSMNPSRQREGVVFKSVDGSFSFKAISNAWLMKNGA
jgi:RNA ligase (TIGR02306 family)